MAMDTCDLTNFFGLTIYDGEWKDGRNGDLEKANTQFSPPSKIERDLSQINFLSFHFFLRKEKTLTITLQTNPETPFLYIR